MLAKRNLRGGDRAEDRLSGRGIERLAPESRLRVLDSGKDVVPPGIGRIAVFSTHREMALCRSSGGHVKTAMLGRRHGRAGARVVRPATGCSGTDLRPAALCRAS